jgi:hypothetical protein
VKYSIHFQPQSTSHTRLLPRRDEEESALMYDLFGDFDARDGEYGDEDDDEDGDAELDEDDGDFGHGDWNDNEDEADDDEDDEATTD